MACGFTPAPPPNAAAFRLAGTGVALELPSTTGPKIPAATVARTAITSRDLKEYGMELLYMFGFSRID